MNVKEHYRTITRVSMGDYFGITSCDMWFRNYFVRVHYLNAWGGEIIIVFTLSRGLGKMN